MVSIAIFKTAGHWIVAGMLFFAVVLPLQSRDLLSTGRTYDLDIEVEKRYPDTEGGFEIWVKNKPRGTEAKLYRTHRSASLMASTDMEWIVVNDAMSSGTSTCHLYRRIGGPGAVDYEWFNDLSVAAWAFFVDRTGRSIDDLHHDYAVAEVWLEKPAAIVISLTGHGGPGHFKVKDWTCVYLIDEDRFVLDFEAMNQSSISEPN